MKFILILYLLILIKFETISCDSVQVIWQLLMIKDLKNIITCNI